MVRPLSSPEFRTLVKAVAAVGLCLGALAGWGCETDGFIDPSRTGYFETTPTAIPILSRIDVIEQASDSSVEYTQPTPDDLVPNTLEYKLAAGDVVQISIPQLVSASETEISTRVIDTAGQVNLPVVGKVTAAGLTAEQLEAVIVEKLRPILSNPKAYVAIEEARAYQFRIMGAVDAPGLYGLNKPDLRILDAIAIARGASPSTTRVLITRAKATDERYNVAPPPTPAAPTAEAGGPPTATTTTPAPTTPPAPPPPSAADIDALIQQLPGSGGTPTPPPTPPADAGASPVEPAGSPDQPRPGMLGTQATPPAPPVDVDQLEVPSSNPAPQAQGISDDAVGDRYTFDNATQKFVKMGSAEPARSAAQTEAPQSGDVTATETEAEASTPGLVTGERARARARGRLEEKKAFSSRVIEIDYNQLVRGSANLNVVIRPEDMIYCDTGEVGVVYIGGEISRPGVYNLPTSGKLTLSRLVDAAGGLSGIAIPERVDLIRRIGGDKEACIRVNLAAIRNRAEPDIFMKADDHVLIGTNFWATPLAVIRNGFRMTYGFGFLVDRNWGNDIFGAPPVNVVGQ
ncbi:MAG: polysaccharide biosynthesis/export family protein [Phycisphaerales bacterium]|jgi:polysaccharide export outer membrane protein